MTTSEFRQKLTSLSTEAFKKFREANGGDGNVSAGEEILQLLRHAHGRGADNLGHN
jgi:hypothetical protein